jgi:glycosyltransferase involved in cell wall biosynthesis
MGPLSRMQSLTIIMPVHNEAEGIEKVVSAFYDEIVRKTGAEFAIAEDGSTDGTKQILQKMSTKLPIELYLGLERKGYSRAAKDALRRASSPYVFFSDSDGQYRPSDFWSLWDQRFVADLVIGRKVNRAEGMHRLILSRGFHTVTRILFGVKLHDIDCGFRLVSRKLLLSILDDVENLEYSFWGEFTIRALASKARIVEMPIQQRPRTEGESRIYTPRKLPMIVAKQLIGLIRLKLDLYRSRSRRKSVTRALD